MFLSNDNLCLVTSMICIQKTHLLKIKRVDISQDAALWDSFFDTTEHHLHSEYIKFYMANTTVKSYCFQVLKQEEVVGQLYLQSAEIPTSDLLRYASTQTAHKCLLSLLNNLKPACCLNFLVCGNVFKSNQAGYELLPEIQPSDAFQSLIDYLEDSKKEYQFVGVLFKDCSEKITEFRELLPYKKDQTMQLHLDPKWDSVDDYVADLDKKYRTRYKKITKNLGNLSFEELSLEQIEHFNKQIYALYLEVTQKQNFRIGELNSTYFLAKKKLLKDKFKIFGVISEGKLIAFSSHILDNKNQLEIHYVGFDYEHNDTHNLYFNILFHGLSQAIKHKIGVLELGRTAEIAKASLGAKPHYKLNYLYFQKHLYKLSFKIGTKILKNSWDIQLRNPFRDMEKIPVRVVR